MNTREVSLSEMLEWARTRSVVETLYDGVRFDDGSTLRCETEQRGYQGSDLTDPDPLSVVYYIRSAE